MKGSPEMTAICAPAGNTFGAGPHFTSLALIGTGISWANADALPARSNPKATTAATQTIAIRTDQSGAAEVIRSILDEAREKPVGEDRCKDICYLFSLQDGAGAPGEDGVAAEAARQAAEAAKRADEVEAARQAAAEAAAILDGPPPELPPTSPESTSSVRDESERKALQHALDTLRPLVTKPVAKFNGVAEQNDLVKAADFLSTMVGRKLVDIDEPGADDPVASAEQRKAEYAATEEQARILSPAELYVASCCASDRALIFAAGLAVLAGAYYWTNVSHALLFWAAFTLSRPLGATLGDFLGRPIHEGGLALSRPIASAAIAAFIIGCILLLPQRPAGSAVSITHAK